MARTVRTKVYKFSELSEPAKEKAISDHIQFEIEIMNEDSWLWYCAEKMEEMQTPWFLGEYIYEKRKSLNV